MEKNKPEAELTKRQKLKLKAKESASKFRKELKKSTITAIIAAFSFLIALTWKDVITEWVMKISEANPFKNSLISAAIITVISVIGIVIASHFGNEEGK